MFDSCPIHREPVHLTLYSDASLEGWGGMDEVTHVGGQWTEAEMPYHINALELQVAYLTLQALGVPHKNVHLRLMLDNTTVTTYINKMGGTHSVVCNLVARAIWEWTIPRNVWLSAAYIPGSQNKVADFKSRHFDVNTEWSLSPVLFARLSQVFYIPWLDLFASRLNRQVDLFVSWKPEPEAWAVDAFSISWRDKNIYAFPLFSVLSRVLSKIKEDNASSILVVPLWPTQPWFPVMLDLLIGHPRHIEPDSRNLHIPGNPLLHPLHKRLTLGDSFIRSTLTGRGLSHKSTELLSHAWREGTKKQYNSTVLRWGEYCCQRKIDSLTPPVNEIINFLSSLFEMGLGYGGITSVRSALGNFVTIPGYPRLADHPLIQKLLKGIGVMSVRPSLVTS